jgi:hypothetical protein
MTKKYQRLDEVSRRGFLAGMMGLAAQGLVPQSVASVLKKELATPAAAAGRLSIPAGLALLRVIKDQLGQYDAEDDDEYYEAWEDMVGYLGMDEDEDDFRDLMDLYHSDPEAAAQQLIQHLEQANIDPNTITVQPRDDWRYEQRIENGERLVRSQAGDLEWVTGTDSTEPDIMKTAQSAVTGGKAASEFTDLVRRVMAAGQTPQPTVKDMGRIEPTTSVPALSAADRSAADIMRDLQSRLDRSLTDQEREIVQQELQKRGGE